MGHTAGGAVEVTLTGNQQETHSDSELPSDGCRATTEHYLPSQVMERGRIFWAICFYFAILYAQ